MMACKFSCRWAGDAVWSQGSLGQHTGQEGKEKSQREAAGGGSVRQTLSMTLTPENHVRLDLSHDFMMVLPCDHCKILFEVLSFLASVWCFWQASGCASEASGAASCRHRHPEETQEEERRGLQRWDPLWEETRAGLLRYIHGAVRPVGTWLQASASAASRWRTQEVSRVCVSDVLSRRRWFCDSPACCFLQWEGRPWS